MKRLLVTFGLCVAALLIFAIASPHFLSPSFLIQNSSMFMETGIVALGSTFVIAAAQIDLSVGSMVGLIACLCALLLHKGLGMPVVFCIAILMGAGLGWLNGVLVARLALPSFLVTLGTMAAFRGAAQAIMGPGSVAIPDRYVGLDQIGVAGIPDPLLIFLILALVCAYLLHRSVFGRWTLAVGSNPSAALYSGTPVKRVQTSVFVISGISCSLAALLMISRLGIARYGLGSGMELDAITIVVVGGTSILGGIGSMFGTVLALVLIDLIKTGMGVANIKLEYQLTVIGLLLIFAVLASDRLSGLVSHFGSMGKAGPAMPPQEST